MAPILLLIGLVYSRLAQRDNKATFTWSKLIPGFVLGFILFSVIRTTGVAAGFLPLNVDQPGDLQTAAALLKFIDEVAKFCILMALAAVGLNTNLSNMLKIGLKPFIVGLCVASVLAGLSLSLILFFNLGAS
jgi:uncharacterized membrane protein YadS